MNGHLDNLQCTSPQSASASRAKRKKYWNKTEIANLIAAIEVHGSASWNAIIQDTTFALKHFSAQDLAKQYYKLLRASDNSNDAEDSFSDMRDQKASQRRERRAFSAKEDELLLEGFAEHGPRWSKILRDGKAEFAHRRSTDLRDRFRNAFPDRYARAGFKSRAPKLKSPRRGSMDVSEDSFDDAEDVVDVVDPFSTTGLDSSITITDIEPSSISSHITDTFLDDILPMPLVPELYAGYSHSLISAFQSPFDLPSSSDHSISPTIPITPRSLSIVESEASVGSMSSISPISSYSADSFPEFFVSAAFLGLGNSSLPSHGTSKPVPTMDDSIHIEEADDWLGNAINLQNFDKSDLF